MAVAGLLQFTPALGIYSNRTSDKHHKCSFRRVKLHLPAHNLSWLTSGQDLFTLHLSESLKSPVRPIPLRYNALHCCSSLLSGPNITSSCMNTVTATLMSPSIIKLVTSAGIVVFALWGVGPLLRSCRNFFLHKNDNNWKKSTTHFILTSYLQPALLWTGAMLVCRALDPAVMPTEASHLVKQRILTFVRSLSTVLSFAYCFSCAIQQAQKFFMQTSDPSNTRNMSFQFAGKAVYTAVWVAAISLFMELLGFSTQKCLTAGGLGTVLLTLAGREIFTNFLSSAMIHATRPFVLNEWIQTKIEGYEVSGTVEHVGWWSPTIIRGEDREAVHIPNHKFTVNIVRNLSQKTHWRIKTHLAISHLDVKKISSIVADMRKVLAKNPQVEQQKLHRRVFLENVDPENQALLILISCFVKTSHHEEYFCVKEAILLDLLRVISHHGARLATPIRSFQRINTDVDTENIPFSRSGATSDRPFLLIEPSYKVNGEEKVKPSRSARSGGDQDSQGSMRQPTSVSTSISDKDSKVANTVVKSAAATNSDKKSGQAEALQSSKIDSSNSLLECSSENSSEHPSASPRPKQAEKLPPTQPALEENIVLEVALEGSKRTLPIDDDHPSTPPPVEAKEAATNRSSSGNGRGTAASGEDAKD